MSWGKKKEDFSPLVINADNLSHAELHFIERLAKRRQETSSHVASLLIRYGIQSIIRNEAGHRDEIHQHQDQDDQL